MSTERGQGELEPWPFTQNFAARLIAAAAWPGERVENRDEWAPKMVADADMAQRDVARALTRLRQAAIAIGQPDPIQAHVDAEVAAALEGAAAEIAAHERHSCFRPYGCIECGKQKERDYRSDWLRTRAAQLRGSGS